jgi:hypothetical protein
MSISYFRRMAAQSFRSARSSSQAHIDYGNLLRLGRKFKARAMAARMRLDVLQKQRLEVDRRAEYRDRR